MATANQRTTQKNASLTDRARSAASGAQTRVSNATSATVDAAKDHPYAAAGIVAGTIAAVGGAAYAATRKSYGNTATVKGTKTKH